MQFYNMVMDIKFHQNLISNARVIDLDLINNWYNQPSVSNQWMDLQETYVKYLSP